MRHADHPFIAWVRIKPFKPLSKAFSTREAAKAWAEDQERQLRGIVVAENPRAISLS